MNGDDPERTQLFVPDAATCLAASEIAAALRISPVTAGIRVRDAVTMTTDLCPTLRALEQGRIDRGKARVLAEHCHPLNPEHTAAVQSLVLPTAEQPSTSELRDLTGQAVLTIDPTGSQERHDTAAARRDLTLRAQPDAMATLNAFLPADGAVKIFQISDLLATGTAGAPGDTRGIGARRVDALVDIADQLLTNGFLDLTGYLGTELPDHGTARARGRYADPDLTGNTEPDPGTFGDAATGTGGDAEPGTVDGEPGPARDNGTDDDTNTAATDADTGPTDDQAP